MRDRRGRSSSPKPLSQVLGRAIESIAPQTPLALFQAAWPRAAGPEIAAVTRVVEEREGTLTIECESSVWVQELELMAPRLITKLAADTDGLAPEKLRFRTTG
jgi:predicted nucleic acid-binding Zn ribbon protein